MGSEEGSIRLSAKAFSGPPTHRVVGFRIMLNGQGLESIIGQAKAGEKRHRWIRVAELYEQALALSGAKKLSWTVEIQERIGYCFHRAAFQAENVEESKMRMQLANEAYSKAQKLFLRLANGKGSAGAFRCKAIVKFLDHWLAAEAAQRRRLLDECLELEEKALTISLESGNLQEYGRTYGGFFLVFDCRGNLEWDRTVLKDITERGLKWGERAVTALSELDNPLEKSRIYFTLATCLYFHGDFIADPEKLDRNRMKAVEHLSRAVDLSEKAEDPFLLGLSHLWLGINTGGEESVEHFVKMLECGQRERNNFLIMGALDSLAYTTYWKAKATEDLSKRAKLAEKAIQFHDKAQRHRSKLPFMGTMASMSWPSGYAEQYFELALWETSYEKRQEFFEKASKTGLEALKLAEDSDQPYAIVYVLNVVSKTLVAQARGETDVTERISKLKEALTYRERTNGILEKTAPFDYWNLGASLNYLAEVRTELAEVEVDPDKRRTLLEEAAVAKEKCLKLCNKIIPYYEKAGNITLFAALQRYQETYATLQTLLYDLTSSPENLAKAIEISRRAIESASKLEMANRIAESHWRIARAQGTLEEYLEAAESFMRASKSYLKAAERIPQLRVFYQDHSQYMEAWSEIEKAKHFHAENQYTQAKEHYHKAAKLHKSTEHWEYLSPNYLAWAQLEEAEDLSRREQTEKAKTLLQQTASLFEEARKSIKAELGKITSREEKELVTKLIRASQMRREYCLGRANVEEAKILDRKGNHMGSSRKYASAANTFKKIADAEPAESSKDIQPLIFLCLAWKNMMIAEAKSSPSMYREAAALFKKAEEHTFDPTTSLLALANSSFCKALEAGTKFELAGEPTLHSAAKTHLEAAAKYYLKAGFKNASEYTKATNRLFDAYMYMHKAAIETELEKKAQYFQMAEKLLQASAEAYQKAKHAEKGEVVQRLLESVIEERQLAISLSKVLHAPTIASATTSFSTPNSTYEQAVGLERFENAHIQATLILKERKVKVGEEVNFDIELVNAGKAPALLVKCEDIIPESFKVEKVPDAYRIEGSFLNLKGKRIAPLETTELKIVVKPQSKGTFVMNPRILYVDESGKYRTHEPEPISITVKELGISGWLKGPG